MAPARTRLYTVGYGGYTLPALVRVLRSAGVRTLLDVRELPLSRKPGFSKTALSEGLRCAGIGYRHLRWLGSPSEARHELRRTEDYALFFRQMRRHLARQCAREQLLEVIELARREPACLMCFCPDWRHCHRKVVAEAIGRRGPFAFCHLPPAEGSA